MGYNTGMLWYIIMAPITRPLNFFKYGSVFVAIWSFINVISESQNLDIETFINAYFEYISVKYLPPTTLEDIMLPIIAGSVIAGIKWRLSVENSR